MLWSYFFYTSNDLFRIFFPLLMTFNSHGTYSPLMSSTNIVSLDISVSVDISCLDLWSWSWNMHMQLVFRVNNKLKIQNRDKSLSLALLFFFFLSKTSFSHTCNHGLLNLPLLYSMYSEETPNAQPLSMNINDSIRSDKQIVFCQDSFSWAWRKLKIIVVDY